jgi:hypothetical protein
MAPSTAIVHFVSFLNRFVDGNLTYARLLLDVVGLLDIATRSKCQSLRVRSCRRVPNLLRKTGSVLIPGADGLRVWIPVA